MPTCIPPGDWSQSHYGLRDRPGAASSLPKVTGHQALARLDGKQMRHNSAHSSGQDMDAGACN